MSNTAFSEGKPLSANNIFADLDALRLSPDAAAVAGTSEILSHVPIRKPNRHEFFRTRSEPEFWFGTGIFEDKEEREVFFVTPGMRPPQRSALRAVAGNDENMGDARGPSKRHNSA